MKELIDIEEQKDMPIPINRTECLNIAENIVKNINYDAVLGTVTSFIDWKSKQKKTNRGGETMYDIKGHYKYLHENELFDYWLEHCNCA